MSIARPVIGLMPLYDEKRNSIWMIPGYADAVAEAGGLPLIITFDCADKADMLADKCDGFLFTGGQDVDPGLYGETRRPVCGEPYLPRDELDTAFLREAVMRDKPVLGICRGLQLFNAATGGTLWQDIPSEYKTHVCHAMKPPYDRTVHDVEITAGTPLADIVGAGKLAVNSYHHQAVRRLSGELRCAAVSEDGLIEAAYRPNSKFFIGVQWHPELYRDISSRRLFEAFVKSCL